MRGSRTRPGRLRSRHSATSLASSIQTAPRASRRSPPTVAALDVLAPDGTTIEQRSSCRHGQPASSLSLARARRLGAADACRCGRSSPAATITRCTTRTARSDSSPSRTATVVDLAARTTAFRRFTSLTEWPLSPRARLVPQLPLRGGARPRTRRHRGPCIARHLQLRPAARRRSADLRHGSWQRADAVADARRALCRALRESRRAASGVSLAPASRRRCLPRRARRGQTIVAGYPVVHRLGTRHVHRAARAVPRRRPHRRCHGASSSSGRGAISEGMLPNRFPDRGEPPEFNSVDASLWFVDRRLRPPRRRGALRHGRPCSAIARASKTPSTRSSPATPRGTRFGIRARRGRPARRRRTRGAAHVDGRQGRRPGRDAAHRQAGGSPGAVAQRAVARRASAIAAGVELFERGRPRSRRGSGTRRPDALNDVVDVITSPARSTRRSGRIRSSRSAACRCALVDGARARRALDAVEARLLDAARTALARTRRAWLHRALRRRRRARDGAYHQGTVWPWLLTAFVEAWVRVPRRTRLGDRQEARARFLAPLLAHLDEAGLGTSRRSPTATLRTGPTAARSRPGRSARRCASSESCWHCRLGVTAHASIGASKSVGGACWMERWVRRRQRPRCGASAASTREMPGLKLTVRAGRAPVAPRPSQHRAAARRARRRRPAPAHGRPGLPRAGLDTASRDASDIDMAIPATPLHWREYLIEVAALGTFMVSAAVDDDDPGASRVAAPRCGRRTPFGAACSWASPWGSRRPHSSTRRGAGAPARTLTRRSP